jgi:hypothetical protein
MKKAALKPPLISGCCIFAACGAVAGRRPLGPGYQEPAPDSVVTARRFCDQQEMSSQTATGRSLP